MNLARRLLLALAALAVLSPLAADAQVRSKPLRIYAITFRGMTDVEKGFQDYFAARKIPVEITLAEGTTRVALNLRLTLNLKLPR